MWTSKYLVFSVTQSTKKCLTPIMNEARLFRNVYGYLPVDRAEHPHSLATPL